ncbi:MAG: protein kinase, partial [Blastocatellia bacterium]|nr:protein kinase [Blastocatellia bacterium]
MGSVEKDFAGTERFEIRQRLGSGGFGVVYEAFDRERNAPVALKTLHNSDSEAIYRFKQEFRALADITHRNLAALYELICEGDQWFFTMELVQGVN